MASKKRISLLNLSLPAIPDVQKDESFVEFSRIYAALRTLASAFDMMQGAQIAKAGTAIGFGRFVNFYNVDGELYAQLADATLGRPAHAFCLSQDVVAGDSVEFVLGGLHPGLAGMTPATRYFLGTAGGVTTSPPALPQIQQALGVAISDTVMWTQIPIDYLGA